MKTKNLTVYKSNQVIEAGYKLSLNEQRVILACIAQINSKDLLVEQDEFLLSAQNFADLFGVSTKRAYNTLIEVAESLFNRYMVIDQPDIKRQNLKRLKMRWISSIGYLPNEGKIILRFSQDILPYLSELKGQFTRYEIVNIGKMRSIYGIRLYELLMQWQVLGMREIEIVWLKKQFQIEKLYANMADFKKRVLEPAVKDINTHSNYSVSWTQRKTGRRVTHLTFTFAENKPKTLRKRQIKEKCILGVPKSKIDRLAKRGESYEEAASRINVNNL